MVVKITKTGSLDLEIPFFTPGATTGNWFPSCGRFSFSGPKKKPIDRKKNPAAHVQRSSTAPGFFWRNNDL
jgi:hypothetical protein